MNQENNIFVYGTLKKEILGDVMPQVEPYLRFGNKGYVKGRLYDLGEYPGAKPARSSEKKVHGQIVIIKPGYEKKVLEELDEYEEFNPKQKEASLFKRQKVKVFTRKNNIVDAWIYWYNKPISEVREINNGIYKKAI